jgi:hypothetical protein
LGIGSEVERFFRALGDQFCQIKLQCVRGFGDGVAYCRVVGKTIQHADGL